MKITQKLVLALALSIGSLPAVAAVWTSTPTKFIPNPIAEGKPLRFLVNIDNANVGSGGPVAGMNGYLPKGGAVGLMNLQLNLALLYSVGMGFDVGLGLHGGVQSPYSMFFGDPPPDRTRYGVMFGADLMARYLAMFSDLFYGGVQVQVGYNYTDGLPGAPDLAYTTGNPAAATTKSGYQFGLGQDSKGAFNSYIPVVAGIVLGADFKDAVALYLFPALELGQTGNYTNETPPSAADMNKGIWKSAVGLQIGVGAAIHTSMGDIVLQLTPRMANFSNKYSWGFDMTTGMQIDF